MEKGDYQVGFIYFNRQDSRVFVRRRFGIGYSFNGWGAKTMRYNHAAKKRGLMSNRLLTATAITVLGLPFLLGAQSKTAPKSFDVASIKLNPRTEANNVFSMTWNPSGIIYRQVTLADCIQVAYGVSEIQITGPAWIKTERYDILARASGTISESDMKQMLQSLLADRFKLAFHNETKDMNAHTLNVGKGEPKLKPSVGEATSTSKTGGFGILLMEHTSMADLVTFMSRRRFFDGPLVDGTGLQGKYDFTLMLIDPDNDTRPNPRAELSTGDQAFFLALARLGLRVDVKKLPTEMFIVDRAEKPTEN